VNAYGIKRCPHLSHAPRGASGDAWLGVSRTYQALYGVGLVLGAYVAGVLVSGDGFLATFASGIAAHVQGGMTFIRQFWCPEGALYHERTRPKAPQTNL
jgi:hypothetical protein